MSTLSYLDLSVKESIHGTIPLSIICPVYSASGYIDDKKGWGIESFCVFRHTPLQPFPRSSYHFSGSLGDLKYKRLTFQLHVLVMTSAEAAYSDSCFIVC